MSIYGDIADFPNFENASNSKVQKINQECGENCKQEHENEEHKIGKNEKGKGHTAETLESQQLHRSQTAVENHNSAIAACASSVQRGRHR